MFNFDRIHDENDRKDREFAKRLQDVPTLPNIGDTVLLNAWLLSRGHEWVSIQAKCLQVVGDQIQVRHTQCYGKEYVDQWVHVGVLNGILPCKKEEHSPVQDSRYDGFAKAQRR